MLDERRKKILNAIVQSYIDLNVPIGSVYITKNYPIGLSPASVRNAMASLEKMGYLMQPHTSAGRVPTEKGYKFYVDTLLQEGSFIISENIDKELMKGLLRSGADNASVIHEAARILSRMSKHLAIAIPPRAEEIRLKYIKFIKYEKKKILCVIVSEDGTVKNQFIELDRVYSQRILDKASEYVNKKYSGFSLRKIKDRLIKQLEEDRQYLDNLVSNMLYHMKDLFPLADDLVTTGELSGTSYLPDFMGMKHIKEVLRAIEDKQFVLKLLNQIGEPKGTKVFVGMEEVMPAMKDMSMVVSTYSDKKNETGTIGIIGPTRMNYRRLIPIVDRTARMLTKILSEEI